MWTSLFHTGHGQFEERMDDEECIRDMWSVSLTALKVRLEGVGGDKAEMWAFRK